MKKSEEEKNAIEEEKQKRAIFDKYHPRTQDQDLCIYVEYEEIKNILWRGKYAYNMHPVLLLF